MHRKEIVRCPRTGRTIEKYVDHGPARVVAGHGRPMSQTYALSAGSGTGNASPAGSKQATLRGAA